MERLRQLADVFVTQFGIGLRARVQFNLSFLLDLVSTGIWMVVYLLFWRVIFSKVTYFSGWTYPSLIAFIAFNELFFGVSRGLFHGALGFWGVIQTGRLDVYLVRPMEVRLACLCINVRPAQLIQSLLMSGLFFGIAIAMGFPFRPLHLAMAFLLVLAAAVGKALVALAINCIAFWWGNVEALHELVSTFGNFLQVPMNVLPAGLQRFFAVGIPLIFAVTYPTVFAAGDIPALALPHPLLWLVGGLGLWWLLQELLWRIGLRKYESYGG